MEKVVVSTTLEDPSWNNTNHLLVWPVILGSGLRLFPDDAANKHKLTLTETRTYKNGIELRVLERAR